MERKARAEARRKFEEENAPEPYADEARPSCAPLRCAHAGSMASR